LRERFAPAVMQCDLEPFFSLLINTNFVLLVTYGTECRILFLSAIKKLLTQLNSSLCFEKVYGHNHYF